ncbi:MAG: very short patch repair endonuclease [Acidaminococcaceae bacterium]|nr:very short patch repair endonuclease [Acidaminococcaceae bacterium]
MVRLTLEKRSKIMKAIRSNNTSIEIMLRRELWKRNIRYRIHAKILGCKQDISIKKYKLAIFVDGDFWHGHDFSDKRIHTNKKYWDNKIRRNMERDLDQTIMLRDEGWIVLRFWESEIKSDVSDCVDKIVKVITGK